MWQSITSRGNACGVLLRLEFFAQAPSGLSMSPARVVLPTRCAAARRQAPEPFASRRNRGPNLPRAGAAALPSGLSQHAVDIVNFLENSQ